MVATVEWKVYTAGGTEHPSSGSATNLNLMAVDAYDSTGTEYAQHPIPVPETGTNYSFERWVRLRFDGTFNRIENIKLWMDSWTKSDPNLEIYGGVTENFRDPINTQSDIATQPSSQWDSINEAFDITPSGGAITSAPGYTKYFVMQLAVPSTVTTPGNIGTVVIKVQYDES